MAAGNVAAGHECGSCAGDGVAIPLSCLLQSGSRHTGRKQGMDRGTGLAAGFCREGWAANAYDRVCGCLAGEVLSSVFCAGWPDGQSHSRCGPDRRGWVESMPRHGWGRAWRKVRRQLHDFCPAGLLAVQRSDDPAIDLPATGWCGRTACQGKRHPYPSIAEQPPPMLPSTGQKTLVHPEWAAPNPRTCQYRLGDRGLRVKSSPDTVLLAWGQGWRTPHGWSWRHGGRHTSCGGVPRQGEWGAFPQLDCCSSSVRSSRVRCSAFFICCRMYLRAAASSRLRIASSTDWCSSTACARNAWLEWLLDRSRC